MSQSFLNKISFLPRTVKHLMMPIVDISMLIMGLLASFSLRLGEWYWPQDDSTWLIFIGPFIAIPIFTYFGLYQAIIRYIGFRALWAVVQAVSLYALLWAFVVLLSGVQGIPRSVTLINWVVAILLIGGARMVGRWLVSGVFLMPDASSTIGQSGHKNVMIYGAGSAGAQLATALTYNSKLNVIAFIDDDPALKGKLINSIKVHTPDDLSYLIEKRVVAEVLLAIPVASRVRRNEIITQLESYQILVRTLPTVAEIAHGKVKVEDLRKISIEDILGRDQVPPNQQLLEANISGKVVMVTGAGGSIGSELSRQILQLQPKKLILFEQSEYSLYIIEQELLGKTSLANNVQLVPVLGSITNQDRVQRVCSHFGVQTIYHAAAYKHVPMVEMNDTEGIWNNIFGTLSCAQAAIATNVKIFVLISTDKAVRPTNTMGATKRLAEMVLQALAHNDDHQPPSTRFVMVRFGNVLNSSGSVIPLFKKQIKQGGPITVTDPEIVRYFMTVAEATQLVIQAGAIGQGGDVFVLDMGEPMRILDLAEKMIRLSGLEVKNQHHPNGDIEICIIGLRPGEKLYEELLIGDNVLQTIHPMIMRAKENYLPWDCLHPLLDDINSAVIGFDHQRARQLLITAVPEFIPQSTIGDVLYDK